MFVDKNSQEKAFRMFSTSVARTGRGGGSRGSRRPAYTGERTVRKNTLIESRTMANGLVAEYAIRDSCPAIQDSEAGAALMAIGAAVGISGGTGNCYLTALNAFKALLMQQNSVLVPFHYSAADQEADKKLIMVMDQNAVAQVAAQMRAYRQVTHNQGNLKSKYPELRNMLGNYLGSSIEDICVPTYEMTPYISDDERSVCQKAELESMKIYTSTGNKLVFNRGKIEAVAASSVIDPLVDHMPVFYALQSSYSQTGRSVFKAICCVVFSVETKLKPEGVERVTRNFTVGDVRRSYEEAGVKRGLFGVNSVVRGLYRTESKTMHLGTDSVSFPKAGTIDRAPYLGDYSGNMKSTVRMLHVNCRKLRNFKSMDAAWKDNLNDILGYLIYTKEKEDRDKFLEVIMSVCVPDDVVIKAATSTTNKAKELFASKSGDGAAAPKGIVLKEGDVYQGSDGVYYRFPEGPKQPRTGNLGKRGGGGAGGAPRAAANLEKSPLELQLERTKAENERKRQELEEKKRQRELQQKQNALSQAERQAKREAERLALEAAEFEAQALRDAEEALENQDEDGDDREGEDDENNEDDEAHQRRQGNQGNNREQLPTIRQEEA